MDEILICDNCGNPFPCPADYIGINRHALLDEIESLKKTIAERDAEIAERDKELFALKLQSVGDLNDYDDKLEALEKLKAEQIVTLQDELVWWHELVQTIINCL